MRIGGSESRLACPACKTQKENRNPLLSPSLVLSRQPCRLSSHLTRPIPLLSLAYYSFLTFFPLPSLFFFFTSQPPTYFPYLGLPPFSLTTGEIPAWRSPSRYHLSYLEFPSLLCPAPAGTRRKPKPPRRRERLKSPHHHQKPPPRTNSTLAESSTSIRFRPPPETDRRYGTILPTKEGKKRTARKGA